ncbi:MAG: hypothetical protein HZA79_02555 [Sphingobacteriales bacterium]|nr:hypothetical protein [Sphingobacteriales bacterium]
MKYLVSAYINSTTVLSAVEGTMDYLGFSTIESNNHYRVFQGFFSGGAGRFADRLNADLESTEFQVEDSIFLVCPVTSADGQPSFSTIIIKRKGNRFLRKTGIPGKGR